MKTYRKLAQWFGGTVGQNLIGMDFFLDFFCKNAHNFIFFTEFYENAHGGPSLDAKSKSALILKKIVLRIRSNIDFWRFLRQKCP